MHLTTIDATLALGLRRELEVDVAGGLETVGMSAPGPFGHELEQIGVRHVGLPAFTRRWDLRADAHVAGQLYRELRCLKPDVLHTHTPKAGVVGRVVGRAAGVRIIVNTCHGLWAQPADRRRKRWPVYAAEAVAGLFSDFELYQNDQDRQTLAFAVRRGKAEVVGNGIDLCRFTFDRSGRSKVRDELGLREGELLVGGVGRCVAEKGIPEFAAAARILAGRARFVWVGPPDLDKADATADVLDGVQLLGFRGDMPGVLSACDVFVLPSHREGMSRVSMEAAACGRPMVLTDIRGCREIGAPGVHALFVPPRSTQGLAAAIGKLIDDPVLRARLGHNASKRALLAFDQGRVAERSLAAYRSVAARKGLRWPPTFLLACPIDATSAGGGSGGHATDWRSRAR
ncbi:MAG: glycosyltransferase family 4 protein [Acidimicrobiales bacterium]